MTDEEKKKMMDDMDEAATVAEQEFRALPQSVAIPVARWFLNHYLKAGHKRLGRAIVSYAKETKDMRPDQYAD